MELKFNQKEIDFIVEKRDIYHWSFAQIADDLGCPYYVDEIEETYERNSEIAIKDSRVDKHEFVKRAYQGMLRAAAERREEEFKWGSLSKKKIKKHMDAIEYLVKRADFWLCWRLYRDNDFKTLYKPTLDHIVPVSKGGTDEVDNLQWLPRFANIWKLAETNEDWQGLVKQVPEFFIELSKLYEYRKMPLV